MWIKKNFNIFNLSLEQPSFLTGTSFSYLSPYYSYIGWERKDLIVWEIS